MTYTEYEEQEDNGMERKALGIFIDLFGNAYPVTVYLRYFIRITEEEFIMMAPMMLQKAMIDRIKERKLTLNN
jgi:hypothetical protein